MKCYLMVWWRSQLHRKVYAAADRRYISAAGALLLINYDVDTIEVCLVRKTHLLDTGSAG